MALTVALYTPTGFLVDAFAPALKGNYGRNDYGEGQGEITFALTATTLLIDKDYILVFYRNGAVDLDTLWVVTDVIINPIGVKEVIVTVVDLRTWLLRGRIVAYKATTAQAQKSGVRYDHMIRAIARENLGSSAVDTARNIARLTIQPDVTPFTVASGSKAFSQRQLLPVMLELVDASANDVTTPRVLSFDVVMAGSPASWSFQVFYNQRGSDRTSLVLSAAKGHIDSPSLGVLASDFSNVAYVGGIGQDQLRTVTVVPSSGAASRELRREVWVDARQTPDAMLASVGGSALRSRRVRSVAMGKVSDASGLVFGVDYFYGDRLTADLDIAVLPVMVSAVRVSFVGQVTVKADVQLRSL